MPERSTVSHLLWSVGLGIAVFVLGVLLMSLVWQVIDTRPAAGVALLDEREAPESGSIVQIEVRNGVGRAGVAATMTTYLRQRGFDVVASGNWSSFDVIETRVIDRVGDPAAAARVARSLGISPDAIVENLDQRLFVDVTVVIGGDYATLPPFQNPSSP